VNYGESPYFNELFKSPFQNPIKETSNEATIDKERLESIRRSNNKMPILSQSPKKTSPRLN